VGRQYQFSAVLQGTLQFKLERRVKLQGRAKELQELYVKPRAKEVKVQANEVLLFFGSRYAHSVSATPLCA
jgi:hypothetical protein